MVHNKLILFIKAPVPGQVKTRLIPVVGAQGAAKLYQDWVIQFCSRLTHFEAATPEIAYQAHPLFSTPDWVLPKNPFPFFAQQGNTLGKKLLHAFDYGFNNNANKMVIVGSDSPDLPLQYIREAYEKLETEDLVLGPTLDGGYYLIGLRRPPSIELFKNVKWSTPSVLEETQKNAEALGYKIHLLPPYFDIDTPEDLEQFSARPSGAWHRN
jgi:rSAM/selenodomain-associated transferase 1